ARNAGVMPAQERARRKLRARHLIGTTSGWPGTRHRPRTRRVLPHTLVSRAPAARTGNTLRTNGARPGGGKQPENAISEVVAIIFPYRFVSDRRRKVLKPRLETSAPFRCIEGARL